MDKLIIVVALALMAMALSGCGGVGGGGVVIGGVCEEANVTVSITNVLTGKKQNVTEVIRGITDDCCSATVNGSSAEVKATCEGQIMVREGHYGGGECTGMACEGVGENEWELDLKWYGLGEHCCTALRKISPFGERGVDPTPIPSECQLTKFCVAQSESATWHTPVKAKQEAGDKAKAARQLPPWLAQAGLGFLEGFLTKDSEDINTCIMGALGPISDIVTGADDIKAGIKNHNLTEIEVGVASLRKVMEDLPPAMEKCKAMQADVMAIAQVLKGFHSLHDVIAHIKSDLEADTHGTIAQEFELMVRSFEEKKYDDFGKLLGQMLHRLVIGPEGELIEWGDWGCWGDSDPSGSFPMCYEGSAGAFGITEDVKVKLLGYANGKGTMNLIGSGIKGINCQGRSFTKSGQTISPDLHNCLPGIITINSVKYCSNDDTVRVTVQDSAIPIPISSTLKKMTCSSGAEVVV